MDKSEIDEVLLVGGSSRIPKVQEMLSDFFGKNISTNKEVNPEEAVAIGAAIQAASIQNQLPDNKKDLKLYDVCPLSLGTEDFNGSLSVLIKRNTPIPVRVTQSRITVVDNQTETGFKIYEGERVMAADNHLLGIFRISGIPPRPRGEVQVELTFDIDENGILTVSAVETESGKKEIITVTKEYRFNEEKVEIVITDAEKFREEDEMHRKRLKAFDSIRMYLKSLDTQIKLFPVGEKRNQAKEYIEECFTWLRSNKLKSKGTFESKEQEFKQNWNKYC